MSCHTAASAGRLFSVGVIYGRPLMSFRPLVYRHVSPGRVSVPACPCLLADRRSYRKLLRPVGQLASETIIVLGIPCHCLGQLSYSTLIGWIFQRTGEG